MTKSKLYKASEIGLFIYGNKYSPQTLALLVSKDLKELIKNKLI